MALLDNLISHWSFDNTANDLHGSHNMTLVNSPTYQVDNPGFGTYSLRTNGSSQYAYTADHADWDALGGTGEWTIAYWIKHASTGGTQFYLNDWTASASTRSHVSYKNSGNSAICRVEVSDVSKDATWGTAVGAGSWYCVIMWRSGDTTYIDFDNSGSPSTGSLGAGASIDLWANAMTWGTRAVSPTGYYSGVVAGLSIWSRDIGATDRSAYYNSGSGLAYGSWTGSGGGGVAAPSSLGSGVIHSGLTVGGPVVRGVIVP